MKRGDRTSGSAAANRRIVSLGVPHGEHRPTRLGGGDQCVGLRNRPRHRLLDEDGDPLLEQRQSDRVVRLGGHRQRHRVDTTVERGHVRFRRGAGLGRDRRCPVRVNVYHRHELRALQRREDPCVVAPEMPDSDDRDPRPRIGDAPAHTVERIRHGRAAPRRSCPVSEVRCLIPAKRGARLTRRDTGTYRWHSTEEQRRQTGYPAREVSRQL